MGISFFILSLYSSTVSPLFCAATALISFNLSVSKYPVNILLTVMPSEAISRAKVLDQLKTAVRILEDNTKFCKGSLTVIEERFIMRPYFAFRIAGNACIVRKHIVLKRRSN